MPITLTNLKKNRKTITVEFEGETADVVYKPSEFTPELESELREIQNDEMVGRFLVTVLSRLIDHWDITDDEGNEYKPIPENLSKLQNDFLAVVLREIGKDIRVEKDDQKN